MYKSSIASFENYFKKLEKEMSVRNPQRVSLIRQIKNISLNNARGKTSDEKTRQLLERVLVKFGINPGAVRMNEQYVLSVGLAKPNFDFNKNGLNDLTEGNSKGVNLFAGVRTNRTKGMLKDFSVSKPQKSILDSIGSNYNKRSNVNVFGMGNKIVDKSVGLGLGKYVTKSNGVKRSGVFDIKMDFGTKSTGSVLGDVMGLSKRERKRNVGKKGLIGALAGAGKK